MSKVKVYGDEVFPVYYIYEPSESMGLGRIVDIPDELIKSYNQAQKDFGYWTEKLVEAMDV